MTALASCGGDRDARFDTTHDQALDETTGNRVQTRTIDVGTAVGYWGHTVFDSSGVPIAVEDDSNHACTHQGAEGEVNRLADPGADCSKLSRASGYARNASADGTGVWKPAVTCGTINESWPANMAIRATRDRRNEQGEVVGGKEWLVVQKCTFETGEELISVKACSLVDGSGINSFNGNDLIGGPGQGGGCQPGSLYDVFGRAIGPTGPAFFSGWVSMSVFGSTLSYCWGGDDDTADFRELTIVKGGAGGESAMTGVTTNIPGPPITESGTIQRACSGATITVAPWDGDACDGLEFTGWADACDGTGECTIAMHEPTTVVALFGRHDCGPAMHWDPSACACTPRPASPTKTVR
jgi:hypothetical protein